MIRLLWLWLPLVGLCSIAGVGQEPQKQLSFSLYLWPWETTAKLKKPIIGKEDPVRYVAEVRYQDRNETRSVRLLPGRQTQRLQYGGNSPLVLDRFLADSNSTKHFATLAFDASLRDALFILYHPKGSNSYENLVVNRTSVSQIAGTGIVYNLSRKKTLVTVNGVKKYLEHKQSSPFRIQGKSQDFTRFQISVESNESDNGWNVAHSSKRYLSKRPGTVFLLSSSGSGGKPGIKVITLSPPR